MKSIPQRGPTVHLARGSECARPWSRYQETNPRMALCGVRLDTDSRCERDRGDVAGAEVSCWACLDLAGPPRRSAYIDRRVVPLPEGGA